MIVNNSKIIITGTVMALAVVIGAFGAHTLKTYLNEYSLDIFKTASFYHFIHGIALFLIIILGQQFNKQFNTAFYFIFSGILLFSGSLYTLALKDIFQNIPSWFGAITPLGGLAFIIGWLLLTIQLVNKK